MRRFALTVLLGLLAISPVRAFTPESGFWWAPNEPGSGIALEIQDNFVFMAAYTYDSEGFSTFFTAQGLLTGNARFTSQLDGFDDGQCVGCPWIAPIVIPNQAGPVDILFDTETDGRLRWGGREIPIERFGFYQKRPEDPQSVPVDVTKMLGEWSLVLDFMNHPNPDARGYYGDILIFDLFEFSAATNRWIYDGCRADDSLIGFCTDFALQNADAAGYYDAMLDRQVMVVFDGFDALGRERCLYYELDAGTDALRTVLLDEIGGVTVYLCDLQNPLLLEFEPVRGFRSASRTFVQEGVGPASEKAASTPRKSILPLSEERITLEQAKAADPNFAHRSEMAGKLTEQVMERVRRGRANSSGE